MPSLYQLIILGSPSAKQLEKLEELISKAVHLFGLQLGCEIKWAIHPKDPNLSQQEATAALFFGGREHSQDDLRMLSKLIKGNIPILPVVSDYKKVLEEIPEDLRSLNCLSYGTEGLDRVATALLECVGLLPKQRRVFISYRRDESRQVALQLFEELSHRIFDVFLDTHKITHSEDFQATLWQNLCNCDVLIMLDTANYFESRWTSAEFGRALAKGISVLQIIWPNVIASARTATASSIQISEEEIDPETGRLVDIKISQICLQLEAVRSQSHAVRNLNLVSSLRWSIERIGGKVTGVGAHKAVYLQLADGKDVVAYPTVGVPTSITLHNAIKNSPDSSVAVIYDHVGLHANCLEHLDWLGNHIQVVRWVKIDEADWHFADWEG